MDIEHNGAGGERQVIGSTIKFNGYLYGSSLLHDGAVVFVRLDPVQAGLAHVFTADQADYICDAICPELSGELLPAVDDVADKTHPRFIAGYLAGLSDGRLEVTPAPLNLSRGASDDTVERVAKALALDMYPDTRWPRDEADANSGIDDRQGRHPISWHFANKCRSQARVAIKVLAAAPETACEICGGRHDNDVLTDICTSCEARINEEGSP